VIENNKLIQSNYLVSNHNINNRKKNPNLITSQPSHQNQMTQDLNTQFSLESGILCEFTAFIGVSDVGIQIQCETRVKPDSDILYKFSDENFGIDETEMKNLVLSHSRNNSYLALNDFYSLARDQDYLFQMKNSNSKNLTFLL
jgi:hypothetical protein